MVIDIELTLNRFGFGKIAENKFQFLCFRFSKWKIPGKYSISFEINWRVSDMYNQVKQFVEDSFNAGVNEKSMKHFEQTVSWLKRLKPDADEPMLIAAYSHDIARAYRPIDSKTLFQNKEFNDPEVLKDHQEQGAQIMAKFLQDKDYNKESIKRVENMIRHHEEGGDTESDIIMDSDSLSYLEINAKKHIGLVDVWGKGKVERKIDWMFDRISSSKAKELAQPYHEEVKDLLYKQF